MNPSSALSFQLLSCSVLVQFDDVLIGERMRYMVPPAQQPPQQTCQLHYRVSGSRPYAIFEEDDYLETFNDADDVLYRIYARAYSRMIDRYVEAGWVFLHAGLVRINQKRVMLIGDSGAGKTTLTARLLFDGHGFEGDEMVLAQPGRAMAAPRCLHLKEGIERNIPELAGQLDRLPTVQGDGRNIYALDPTGFGLQWEITIGTIDHIVYVRPNHGSDTSLTALSTLQTMKHVTESFMGWGRTNRLLASAAADLSRRAGHELALGDPVSGARLLEKLTKQ